MAAFGLAWIDLVRRIAKNIPKPYRRHGLDQQRQAVDLSLGISGGSYREEPEEPSELGANTIGRNDPCPCGSGTKYKRCCGRRAAR